MQNRPQEWSLHAQVTISHGGGSGRPPDTTCCQPTITSFGNGNGGVRMEYSVKTFPPPPPTSPEPSSGYGFQRGNILFTTRPPPRGTRSHSFHYTGPSSSSSSGSTLQASSRPATLGRIDLTHTQAAPRQDSGYNSEYLLSPHSYGSLPTRNTRGVVPYNRRCMSTYSIMLEDARVGPPIEFSPVPEVCEQCSPRNARSSPHTFSSHFCTNLQGGKKPTPVISQVKDAASQTTTDTVAVSTPTTPQPRMGSKVYNTRRKTDSDVAVIEAESLLLQVPTLQLPEPDDIDKPHPSRRLTRSPARLGGKSPLLKKRTPAARDSGDSSNDSSSQSGCKQLVRGRPRTVHIDVYCTGSDDDADTSDSESTSSASTTCSSNTTTPQTVYESDKLRIVHTRPKRHELPLALARKQKQVLSRKSESFKYTSVDRDVVCSRGYESDDATLSSLYPSRSSFDSVELNLPDCPTRDPSWSTLSSSTMLLEDETTSWKDTTESGPEIAESSLAQSDSFEYADSIDRLRIQEKEQTWSRLHFDSVPTVSSCKTWRSPESERRQLIQRQRFEEFLTKHLNKPASWSVRSTTSSGEDNWDASSKDESHFGLTRGDTVRRAMSPMHSGSTHSVPSILVSDTDTITESSVQHSHIQDTIGPFGRRPPSPPPPKLQSKIISPFTTPQGAKTVQQLKAEKFGPIVGSLKKPGNHIGPSKNPECCCEHCRKFYEESMSFRGRACSVGDAPRGSWQETVEQVASSSTDKEQPKS